ncbi:dephospho-CoA kinase [Maribacter sp. CXY002]|uniref:dephospho-CoA kinase n=1 Tax=Maribacter luteocoastalis TaxID=3407671 RepID=UPI003B6822DA
MMIVGLTGGIGSGKSTVGNMFKKLGVPVYNSDKQAKKLMDSSKKIHNKIIDLLGEQSYVDGKLNRAYIADKVFGNKELLTSLNAIVHPAVRKHFLKWATKQNHPYVIQETALLFENGSRDNYDKVILVTAPIKIRIQRVVERDNSSKNGVLARMKNQLDDDLKIEKSDFVIENIDWEKTSEKVAEINSALLEYC